jgi:ParB/RepB/Spo0J family partition protein
MTTTDAGEGAATVAVLAPDQIIVREGWNPRTGDDEAERDQLTDSVRAQGILQPLLVERTDEGAVLIDGHRRLAAARAAGLSEVPVIERAQADGDAPRLAASLAANMRRRGLDPIEEARAYARAVEAGWPQRRVAGAVGCSPRHVSQRLRLLRLPEGVQEAIGCGALPLSAVVRIETIAAVSPAVAEVVAAGLRDGSIVASELTEHPDGVLHELAAPSDEGAQPILVALPGYLDLGALALDADLAERAAAAGLAGVSLSAEDMDAARAFGCLIEFDGGGDRYWRRGFVADAAFLVDRVRLHVERAEQRMAEETERRDAEARERAERAAAAASERGEDPEAASAAALAESESERRARERAEAAEDRRSARLANLDLGRRAMLAFDEPQAVSVEMARVVALTALHHHRTEAARGLGLCHERLQATETRTTRAGATREKVSYPDAHEAERALAEWIEVARSPEQVIGRAVQALALAWFADQAALPRSERRPAEVPGRWGGGLAAALPGLVADLARPVLPERMASQLRADDAVQARAA